jgi:hypothetical protein
MTRPAAGFAKSQATLPRIVLLAGLLPLLKFPFRPSTSVRSFPMDQRRLFGGSADALCGSRGRKPPPEEAGMAGRGNNAINFLGNPSFRPSASFVSMASTKEMDDREDLLNRHVLVVSEHGPLGLRSAEEFKVLLFHHFGLRKHELYVYRSNPTPFITFYYHFL